MSFSTINKLVLSFFVFVVFYANEIQAQCGFTANQRSGCQGFQLNLQDTTTGSVNTGWTITFADGTSITTSNNHQASQLMSICGRVKVAMTTTIGSVVCTKVDSNFTVHCPPVIRGTFSTHNICLGQTICYTDASTMSAGCSPLRYIIDWGQSPLDTVPGCRRYTLQGTFSPSVIITDACGCRSDTTFSGANSLNVTSAPVASFSGTPLSSCATPLVSTMTAATGSSSTIFKWYINGAAAAAQSGHSNIFVHSYPTGTYSIKLVALDSLTGCADTMVRNNYVTVGSFAAACYTESVTSGCAPKLVNYCSCTPGALSYVWSFPGGTPSTYTTTTNGCISVNYATAGSYSSQLIVYYNGGCVDTLKHNNTVTIGQPYTLGITTNDTFSCTLPYTVNLTYTGQPCAACTFSWNPPPASSPSSHTGATYIITSYQSLTPVLIVTDPFGCASTLIKNNYIQVTPLKAKVAVTQYHNGCINDSFLVVNTTLGRPFQSVIWNFPGAIRRNIGQDSVIIKYPASGCHPYSLIVRTLTGCIDTLRDSICVYVKPVVTLTVDPHDVCYEQLCNTFTITVPPGVDTPTSILIYPEGLPSTISTVIIDTPGRPYEYCYFYQNIGGFLPCYVAKHGQCIGDTICTLLPGDTVHINAPAADFKKILGCGGSNAITLIDLSKLADSIVWKVDGVQYSQVETLLVNLTGPCTTRHKIILTAYNYATGCVHSKSDSFYLPCAGVDFAADGSRKGCANPGYQDTIRIVYADTNVTHPTNIVWDINPFNTPARFTPPTLTGPKLALNLTNPGSYRICAQLTYSAGCVDTLCKPNYIVVSRPTAAFTVNATAGCSPFNVQFNNTSTYQFAPQTSFTWSFGDVSAADHTTVNPLHTYTGVNNYIASLTVVDSNGCSSIATRNLTSNIVTANFSMSDTITCHANTDPNNPITFTNTSTGFVGHYSWTLPAALGPVNASPGDVSSFSSQFTQQGTGQVCLTATSADSICSNTICKTIHVLDPVADYEFPNLSDTFKICPNVVIRTISDSSKNDICSYSWDFGDGSRTDTARNSSHIYLLPGFFPITHIVTSCHGCADTIVKYNINIKGPVVNAQAQMPGGCPCTWINLEVTTYDTDSIEVRSGNADTLFKYIRITRGTASNPTVTIVPFHYCAVGENYPQVVAFDLLDSNCSITYPVFDTIVIDTPSIAFAHAGPACGTTDVCFTDQTTYLSTRTRTVQRAWDFGDGTPADSTLAPCHHYAAPGDYTVSLFVKNTWGCFNTLMYNIHINAPPRAVIVMDDTIGCVPLLIHFRDSSVVDDSTAIASGSWSFGDATSFNTFVDTSHTYTVPNTTPPAYTVVLAIRDGYGCVDTARRQVQVKPAATVAAGPAQLICLGDTATLSATGTAPLHWSPVYNIDTSNPAAPRVWPRMDTTYYVRGGDLPRCWVYDSVRVNVSIITASDTASYLCLGQVTQFTARAQSTHATISSYFWRFGDGTTAPGQVVTHMYPVYGVYIDSMIVTNSLGCRDTVYSSVTIGDKPHAQLGVSANSLCLGAPLTVTNTSTPGTSAALAAFSIDMQADGTPEYTTSPAVHTYPAVGMYTIRLIQADINGCIDSAKQSVTVHNNPVAIFTGDSNCILLSNRLAGSFRIGDGSIAHYNWTINGTPQALSDSSTIHRTYTTPGIYNICLSVTDVFGCQSPDSCSPLTIISQPTDTIDPLDTTLCLGYSAAFHLRGQFTSVQWVPSTWLDNPNGTDVIATPRQPIKYLVYANYGHCHPKVDTVSIYVVDSIPVEASANPENIVLGLNSNITSTTKGLIDSIIWDPDSTLSCRNCRNPVATPHTTTTYTATIYYSKNGFTCSNKASVTVTVISSCDGSLIYVPNTFTPNNDGTNDVFRLRGQGITNVNYFRVYDRWGKVVYEITNADDPTDAGWNGGLNNDKARPENSGVFVYAFEIKCVTGQTVTGKGNVTLVR